MSRSGATATHTGSSGFQMTGTAAQIDTIVARPMSAYLIARSNITSASSSAMMRLQKAMMLSPLALMTDAEKAAASADDWIVSFCTTRAPVPMIAHTIPTSKSDAAT